MKLNFENKDISVIKGSLHLANLGITNLEKILVLFVQVLELYTRSYRMQFKKTSKYSILLVYDNAYTDFY